MPMATASRTMIPANSLRRALESLLESSMPQISVPGSKTTAAATTGPAKGPIPASSTPATRTVPLRHSPRSFSSIEFNRRRSARAAALARASRRPRRRTPTLRSPANSDNTEEVTRTSPEARASLIWDNVNREGSSATMQFATPADFDRHVPGPGAGNRNYEEAGSFSGVRSSIIMPCREQRQYRPRGLRALRPTGPPPPARR